MNAASSISPDLLAAALDYAAKGLPVFPCDPKTKRPCIDGGFHAASKDAEAVRAWWARWPDAMIGMPTGAVTGFWALDIDDPEAFEAACPVDLPATRRVDTGKGYHLYFKYYAGAPIRNQQKHAKRGWPFPNLPGAETRGDGGYVIVPPSLHPSGRRYRWHDAATVVDAPAALLALLGKPDRAAQQAASQDWARNGATDTPYGLAALQAECAAIRSAGNGEQESTLNEAALKVGALLGGEELAANTARSRLIAAALAMTSYNAQDAWTPASITAKIERGLADGARHPRSAPERPEQPPGEDWGDPGPSYDDYFDQETGECIDQPEPAAELTLLPLVDISAWKGTPPQRLSFWGDWLPANQTTMLTGRGGIGKSLFEQSLFTAIALGRRFLGIDTVRRNTLYLTCEDDEAELWRRQDAINEAFGISRADLVGKLHLCSLMGETDTALASFDASGRLLRTPRWHQFEHTCQALNIALFAFDNATDAMAGDLNDLHQVAEFVNLLTGLAKRMEGAAMILHHPNKAGDDWLGSVAWHNKVRSRLIIEDSDNEADPDGRVVRNPKANYGPQGGKVAFRWYAGAFVREEDLSPDTRADLDQVIAASGANEAFLRCLRARAEQGAGREVGPSSGANFAPSQFEGMPEAKGYRKEALKAAMNRLYALGKIRSESLRDKKAGRDKTVIVEVSEGPHNAAHNAAQHARTTPHNDGTTPHHTHVGTTYHKGAPPEAAAPYEEGAE